MDWSKFYPEFFKTPESGAKVEFVDIGCGYGGLLGKEISTTNNFYSTFTDDFVVLLTCIMLNIF